MISTPCIIILDRATSAEREAVQELIRENANGWWHYLKDAWIVGGHVPHFWMQLISPAIPVGPSGVLVLRLPEAVQERSYAAFMPKIEERGKWLSDSYSDQPGTNA